MHCFLWIILLCPVVLVVDSACTPGEDCQRVCSENCMIRCGENGKCSGGCRHGWKGDSCDEVCEEYTYGPNCGKSCGHCRNDEACNVETGVCRNGCVAGWRGQMCNESCEAFTYGLECKGRCGHCRQDKKCNLMTGYCSSGCKPGWTGDKCDRECEAGKYGIDCSSKCGNCEGNKTCEHESGQCNDGCSEGWMGSKCNRQCLPGYFGVKCQSQCGHCNNGTCHHVTGRCVAGCASGWTGDMCQNKCTNSTYGFSCGSQCGHCRNGQDCDPVTGMCTLGCDPGWQGLKCKQSCNHGYYGNACMYKCGFCAIGTTCNITDGLCDQGCEVGFMGPRCLDENGEQARLDMKNLIVPVLVSCIVVLVVLFTVTLVYFVFIRPRHGRLFSRFYRLTTRSYQDPESHIYEQVVCGPWELNRYNLVLTNEKLGTGQFGMVKKGYFKKDREHRLPVAVKSLRDNASEKDKNDFMNELNILKKVGQHPNVVCLVGACHIQGTMYLAMEFVKNGDLRSYLRKQRKAKHNLYANTKIISPVQQTMLLKFALDVATGLNHLAEKQIIHRDLAARNVLLDENLTAKVADFGLSKHEDTYVKTSNTRVPVRWMAPESLFNALYTTQSDVWSFGILLWEIATLGGTPYHGLDTQQMCNLLKQGFRMRRPENCDPSMYAMMLQCWNEKPECRPCFSELTMRLQRMLDDSQVYMNIEINEGNHYAEIK